MLYKYKSSTEMYDLNLNYTFDKLLSILEQSRTDKWFKMNIML